MINMINIEMTLLIIDQEGEMENDFEKNQLANGETEFPDCNILIKSGQEIKEIREWLGFTQKQMGKALGMTPQAFWLIENVRTPTLIHAAAVRLLMIIKKGGLIDQVLITEN